MKDISSIYRGNPWRKLPKKPPFILPEDEAALLRYGMDPAMIGLRTELYPIPYLGDPSRATIAILSLNPGFKLKDLQLDRENALFHNQTIENISFDNDRPFYFLSPEFRGTTAYNWWATILKDQIKEKGIDIVSNRCMSITYHGYRSPFYIQPPCILPSQNFSFELVRYAIKNKKCIVVLRSKKLWVEAIPELAQYPYIEIKNYRRPILSERNMNRRDFGRLMSALDS